MTIDLQTKEHEAELRALIEHAWDQEVRFPDIQAWKKNFCGEVISAEQERLYSVFALTRYMYFSKRLVREMLKSLYRDHFRAPLIQRLRRNFGDTKDKALLTKAYEDELANTRFIGVGNPSESGAHLLYYFRQVNHLPKDLFVDFHGAFKSTRTGAGDAYEPRNNDVRRYVFFDDLVGSGTQVTKYLSGDLALVRAGAKPPELRFLSLFAMADSLARLNGALLFKGLAVALFELDESFKAFLPGARYFRNSPAWFDPAAFRSVMSEYGERLCPGHSLGYNDGQLLLAFSHNTPDNAPPVFWDEGRAHPWAPVFLRYDKVYG